MQTPFISTEPSARAYSRVPAIPDTHRLGRGVTESSPAEKGLGLTAGEKLTMNWH